MPFGWKKDAPSAGEVATVALVAAAGLPLTNISRLNRQDYGSVYVLADQLPQPVYVGRRFMLDEHRWLVAGMRIPIWIDPAHPEKFRIDWDSIPSIEERARANDPTLADPIGTQAAVFDTLRAGGFMAPDVATLPTPIGEAMVQAEAARAAATPDRFAESMEKAASLPAPAGSQRAVVLVATMAGRIESSDYGGGDTVTTQGKHPAVLSVNIPGQAPYAVYVPKFNRPKHRVDMLKAGLPALVSITDPTHVEVQWDETASIEQQVTQRFSDQMRGTQAAMAAEAAYTEQVLEQYHATGAVPPAPGTHAPVELPAETRAMMERNAKQALAVIKDPAQRQMLLEQYRLAGIEVDEG